MVKPPSYRVLVLDGSSQVLADYEAVLSRRDDGSAETTEQEGVDALFACLSPPSGFPLVDLELTSRGAEALAAVESGQRQRNPFSLAFIELPADATEEGLQLLERIRAIDPDIHFVLASTMVTPHPLEIAERIPPLDQMFYLQKPFHAFEVQQFVMALTARWRAERSRNVLKQGAAEGRAIGSSPAAWEGIPGGLMIFDRRDRLVSANAQVKELLPELFDLMEPGTPYSELQTEIARRLLPDDTVYLEEAWVKERLEWHAKSGGVIDQRLSGGRWLLLVEGSGSSGETYCLFFDITGLKRRDQNRATSQRVWQIAKALEAFSGKLSAASNEAGVLPVKDLDRNLFWPARPGAGEQSEVLAINGPLEELGRKLRVVTQVNPLLTERLRLDGIVGDLVRDKADSLPSDIELEVVAGAGLWEVTVDAALTRATVEELIDNAAAQIDGPGRILIETENLRLNRDFVSSRPALAQGDYVHLTVRDDGAGMTAEQAERAFSPFFTSRAKEGRLGLGLSMALGYINQSGGHIEIEAAPDMGTSVHIFLPRAKAEMAKVLKTNDSDAEKGMIG